MKRSRKRTVSKDGRRGFSLPEMLIVVVLSAILLAAIDTSLVALLRGSVKLQDYSVMSGQARLSTQYFRQDVLMATDINTLSATGFTLIVPNGFEEVDVVEYLYDDTEKELYRIFNGFSRLLMNNVEAFQFNYSTVKGFPTTNPIETKKVTMTADLSRGKHLNGTRIRRLSGDFCCIISSPNRRY